MRRRGHQPLEIRTAWGPRCAMPTGTPHSSELFHFTGSPRAEMVALANAAECRPVRIVADRSSVICRQRRTARVRRGSPLPGIEVVLPDRLVPVEALMPNAYRCAGEG